MTNNILKDSFEVESKIEAFYTKGNIEWSEDGDNFFCQNDDCVTVLSASKSMVKICIGKPKDDEELDTINSFTTTKDGKFLVTHHKSSLFKLWNTEDGKPVKLWKSLHNGPVTIMALTNDATKLASGGADGSVRLWDFEKQTCYLNLKDAQGVIQVLCYCFTQDINFVFASGDDCVIHGWKLQNGKKEFTLTGHMSKVTALKFHEDGVHAVSSGRDRVLILWDLLKKTSVRVLPTYECLEGAFIISNDVVFPINEKKKKSSIYVASAGEKGVVKIWEMTSGKMIYEQTNSLISGTNEDVSVSVLHLLYNKNINSFGLVSTSYNILIHSLENFEYKKQYVGFIDEVLAVVYLGKDDSHLAVATNTADIKLYDLLTMNCKILSGHTNIVFSLASSRVKPNLLISSSKDSTVKLWLMDENTKEVNCIATGNAHLETVTGVALCHTAANFFVSVSKDLCLKVWEFSKDLTQKDITLRVVNTVQAHSSERNIDINSVVVSPNDKLVATAGQDKLAKLWCAETLQLKATFKDHRKGVWCVRFSPIDQLLATSSADCTIKLWCLNSFTCVSTFEGHDCGVMTFEFLSRGMQILSTGADGLIKLWSVKMLTCTLTLDAHDEKAWSLAVNKDESKFVSGGADSRLIIWKDMTVEKKEKARALEEQMILEDQSLRNCLQSNKLSKALKLALKLQKPMHVLHIVEEFIKKDEDEKLISTINELKPLLKEELLNCAVTWNTNAKNCHPAQVVFNIILKDTDFESSQSNELKLKLESVIPYTDRHFKRVTQLYQDLHLLDYTINCMKAHSTVKESEEDM